MNKYLDWPDKEYGLVCLWWKTPDEKTTGSLSGHQTRYYYIITNNNFFFSLRIDMNIDVVKFPQVKQEVLVWKDHLSLYKLKQF